MLAVTVVLLLHSAVLAINHAPDTNSADRAHHAPATISASANSTSTNDSIDQTHALSTIIVLPKSALSLPALKGDTKSPLKESGGSSFFHKLGGAFHGSKKNVEPAANYTYPDSDFSFDPDPQPTSKNQ
jgi:hypothetical protein